MTRTGLWAAAATLALLGGCGAPKTDAKGFTVDPDFEKTLQQRLLDAKPGDVIDIPAGKYELSRSLSLTGSGVTIRGAGMDKTVLSFAKATRGRKGCSSPAMISRCRTSRWRTPRATRSRSTAQRTR